jgi:hypothetical protein
MGKAAAFARQRLVVSGILFLALVLRLVHLADAMNSPLTYQPGVDDEYYQRFGQAVAAGQGQLSPEFTFMDPAYGYLLGALFKLVGVNLFIVYLLQVVLDTVTVYGILTVGRLLGRVNAGLYGALLYALTSTAIMFCTTLLKEIWVSSFMTWWVVCALVLTQSPKRRWGWLLFGALCAVGVALRSTLLLMGLVAMVLPWWSSRSAAGRRGREIEPKVEFRVDAWAGNSALVAGGMILALAPWSLRNHAADGAWSPLPNNAGIVLHQIYNVDNPSADMWVPGFVNYSHPSDIWRGYAAEASRRLGHLASPKEVDGYWRKQALSFMHAHVGDVLNDLARKSLIWLSSTEVPGSRADIEEQMFSPVLRVLPPPGVWLFALGFAGLMWLAAADRRWMLVAMPIAVAWLAFVVFFAESRFRFHATSMLAMGSGVWIDQVITRFRGTSVPSAMRWPTGGYVALAGGLVAAAIALGIDHPALPAHWDRIAWGYIKMGNLPEARRVAERAAQEQPDNGPILEVLGYMAAAQKHYGDAQNDLSRAIELRPHSHLAHYNLARVYMAEGNGPAAMREARIAAQLQPSPDYDALVTQLIAAAN